MYAKRAVVVGINEYGGANNLPSCVKDAREFKKYLKQTKGFKEKDIELLLDSDATIDKFNVSALGSAC